MKRLETTKDETRKDEINELLNTIDLQLKEIAKIKALAKSDWDYLLDGVYISNQTLLDEGLNIGDRIVTLNGENVTTSEDLANIVAKFTPGDSAVLVVARGFEQFTVEKEYITSATTLPARTSGEEIVEIDGRPYRMRHQAGGLTINTWQFPDE